MKLCSLAAATVVVLAASGAQAARTLAPEPAYSDLAPQVSPDGTQIVFLREGVTSAHRRRAASVYTVGIDGRDARALTRGSVVSGANSEVGNYDAVTGVTWSADGRRVAYARDYVQNRYVGVRSEIVVADADGANARTIVPTAPPSYFMADSPSWSSRDEILFANFSSFWSVRPDGSGLVQIGDPYESKFQPAWSPDATKIAYVGARGIELMNADGSGSPGSVVFGGKLNESSPAWSPDGKTIAFSAESPGPAADIYTAELDGSHLRRLTTNPAPDITPAWTPDGKSIVFASARGRGYLEYDLWVMDADGSHQRRLISRAPWRDWNGRRCTIAGTAAADRLDATATPDVLCGGAGNDVVYARNRHRDFVDGGPGQDRAQVDPGLDVVKGVEKLVR
jgi:Tol biopolymer transport system component